MNIIIYLRYILYKIDIINIIDTFINNCFPMKRLNKNNENDIKDNNVENNKNEIDKKQKKTISNLQTKIEKNNMCRINEIELIDGEIGYNKEYNQYIYFKMIEN